MSPTLLALSAAVCLISVGLSVWRYRDSFHPTFYLGVMLAILYVGYPLQLLASNQFAGFLTDEELVFIQTVNLAGISAIVLGIVAGSGPPRPAAAARALAPDQEVRLRVGAVALGAVGAFGYYYGISNAGGFAVAYGNAYGGGTAMSGYVRELFLLPLPAILLMAVAHRTTRPSLGTWLIILTMTAPLLLQGMLGARRGPTAMAFGGLGVAWYLLRGRRPSFLTLSAVGSLLGFFLLLLVTNRDQIYIGSKLHLDNSPLNYLDAGAGNEYLYGGANIIHSLQTGAYFWGRRQIVLFFVRPIPSGLWPGQYDQASAFLGLPEPIDNGSGGLPTTAFLWGFGWRGAPGSTPGIVADLWVDFWWFGLLGLFLIGWVYGKLWRKEREGEPFWAVLFGLATALSVYLVMQAFEAMAFRFMIMVVATLVVWNLAMGEPLIRALSGDRRPTWFRPPALPQSRVAPGQVGATPGEGSSNAIAGQSGATPGLAGANSIAGPTRRRVR